MNRQHQLIARHVNGTGMRRERIGVVRLAGLTIMPVVRQLPSTPVYIGRARDEIEGRVDHWQENYTRNASDESMM